MPGTDGLTAIGRIMARCPIPILVVTGQPPETRTHTLFEAVRRGALDLFPKPALGNAAEEEALRSLVRRLANVPVVRHLPTRSMMPGAAVLPSRGEGVRVVAIGASAGGPAAVATVLGGIPAGTPASFVVVQHLLPGFTRPFADFLRRSGALPVRVVDEEVALSPGTVFVAPDERHVVAVRGDKLAPIDDPPEGGHRPSVDVLFRSVAGVHGKRAAGVLLSGMGEDCVSGLDAIRLAGGLALAQAEEGCAVYGMPRAALARGAARAVPVESIAEVVVKAARDGSRP